MRTHTLHFTSRALIAFAALALLFAGAPVPAFAAGTKARDAACPFTGAGVVDFGTKRLVASKGITEFSRKASFPAGTYTVRYFSYDGYVGRENADVNRQDEEQWKVLFLDADGNEVVTLGPTEDVPDGVELGQVTGSFGDNISFSRDVARVVVRHVRYPKSDEPHSVVPRCVQVTEKETPQPPARPACPLTPGENRTIVSFGEKKLRSDKGWKEAQSARVPVSLSPGLYTVTLAAWDGYLGRENASQPDERYKVILTNDKGFISGTAATVDLEDNVVEALQVNKVHDGNFLLSEAVTEVYAQHAVYPDTSSPNSVYPICAAFEKVGDPPAPKAPVCELWAEPGKVAAGASTTIYWRAEHVTGGSIDQGIGAVDALGSTTVPLNKTTTFTGTFTGSDGTAVTCSTTVAVYVTDAFPQCTLTVSPARVTSASQAVTLSWTSVNAVGGTITPDVGDVAATGSRAVVPGGAKTYTGVFKDAQGNEASCSASVTRASGGGGGGRCLNCGSKEEEDKDEPQPEQKKPKVVVAKKVVTAKPGSFVYLNQIPYTGFEAGPFVTALFWAFLLAVSAALSYFLVMRDGARRLWQWLMGPSAASLPHLSAAEENKPQGVRLETEEVIAQSAVAAPVLEAHEKAPREKALEQAAQQESILLSPQAQHALLRAEEKEGSDTLVEEVLALAKETFPREDGWILLSPERVHMLLARRRGRKQREEEIRQADSGEERGTEAAAGKSEEASPLAAALSAVVGAAARQPSAPYHKGEGKAAHDADALVPHGPLAGAMREKNGAAEPAANVQEQEQETAAPAEERLSLRRRMKKFLSALAQGDQRGAYRVLQETQAAQVEPDALLRLMLRELDEAYKQRLEGGRKPDKEVVALTRTWQDKDFELVLAAFADSVDFSYGAPLVGAKIALTKLNGFFARRSEEKQGALRGAAAGR